MERNRPWLRFYGGVPETLDYPSTTLYEALRRKEGMAAAYGNLGRVYQTRGDLAQAAAMYKKSIALFQQLGATPQVQQVQASLDQLAVARAMLAACKIGASSPP